MRIRSTILIILVTIFGTSINSDVLKWVDENGNTHYSNKEKKLSRNKAKIIKFVEYESAEENNKQIDHQLKKNLSIREENFTDVSGDHDYEGLDRTDGITHRFILGQLDAPKSYIKRKSRNTRRIIKQKPEYTIAEYNQRCEDAREELIAPLRQEAILVCMKLKQRMTSRTRDYCEDINDDFGDGGMNTRGFYIQRMFHHIPECQESYEAWNRRSRKMRGYSDSE